jgi:peptide/nickel transport system ATP-binding protein
MDYALNVENLSVRSATGALLVDDVSFTLQPGEVVGLIGESGAGKSTIGLACLGYVRAGCEISGGKVIVGKQSIFEVDDRDRRKLRGQRVAYIAQSAAGSFNPSMKIGSQVTEAPVVAGQLSAGESRKAASGIFRELFLPDFSAFGKKYPHEASGGQLQRAMAAMAMTGRPQVLVFDEPTTALDVTTQVEVLTAFRNLLRGSNCAAVYISHDIAVVSQMVDKIIVLRGGRMVEAGKTEDILSRPSSEYTAELVRTRTVDDLGSPAPEKGGTFLTVRDLTAGYGSQMVLKNVNLDLGRGSVTAVVGESGSGKSTLARCIVGLLAPRAGEIRFDGKALPGSVAKRSLSELRRIQLIHQNPDMALNPRMTVRKTIMRALQVFQGVRGKAELDFEVRRLLSQVELPETILDRPTARLSGGQKQRVCISRALAAKPELVVCDEVTASLDQLVADGILDLLKKLSATREASILFISHDLGIVRRIADQVVVMKSGQLVEQGAPSRILMAPEHPYTVKLVSSVPEPRVDWLSDLLALRQSSASKAQDAKVA